MSSIIKYKYRDGMDFLDPEDISQFIEKASLGNSPWYKGLSVYSSSPAKNYLEHWKLWWDAVKSGHVKPEDVDGEFTDGKNKAASITGKRCPGIIGILNKSWIVKSPIEAIIHIENGDIQSIHCSDNRFLEIDSHDVSQYRGKGNNLFYTKKSLKFTLPVEIKTKIPYVFFSPVYHKEMDFDPVPGVIEDQWIENTTLVVHCMTDITKDRYINIKPGDPLAYIWFPENTKLQYDPTFKDKRFMKYLNRPLDFFGKK